jgi:hypothetical protein
MDWVGGFSKVFTEVLTAHGVYLNTRAALERTDPIFMGYTSLAALGRGPMGFADAGFGKFRTLSATYTFPRAWARSFGASRLSLTLAGDNLGKLWGVETVFGHKIMEIEQTQVAGGTVNGLAGGTQGNAWPQNRRFTSTLRVTF